ncbi:cytoplasmic tRNA 2-thiolation protein [Anaeramoeba flamelloides]|uniref:Cytoplasmic tRNA 2-thiolation protein n=1 Tax=Anaeramoeba flamelloides TaxID=1746091 RepID=A0ABQ8Z103_9EUKA|nr:cytoplasmic tRNA 2-thiolation protein [Anaeramoeba flamelloides]
MSKKMLCSKCKTETATLILPRDQSKVCRECFFHIVEDSVHRAIVDHKLFTSGDILAVGASGGKDSTTLIHILHVLNEKYEYGADLHMVSIDEGIKGYRDESLDAVRRNQKKYGWPLTIVSFKDMFGYSLDTIVKLLGPKRACTHCGIFRRQALEVGAKKISATKIVLGHNANDYAETTLLNLIRGDLSRLKRGSTIITDSGYGPARIKPFKYVYQEEIVKYAFLKKLDYHSVECPYAVNAQRGLPRVYLNQLDRVASWSVLGFIKSNEQLQINEKKKKKLIANKCIKCGFLTSQKLCQGCVLRQKLDDSFSQLTIKLEEVEMEEVEEYVDEKEKENNFKKERIYEKEKVKVKINEKVKEIQKEKEKEFEKEKN